MEKNRKWNVDGVGIREKDLPNGGWGCGFWIRYQFSFISIVNRVARLPGKRA